MKGLAPGTTLGRRTSRVEPPLGTVYYRNRYRDASLEDWGVVDLAGGNNGMAVRLFGLRIRISRQLIADIESRPAVPP
jgi:hypothetical protein